MKILMCTDGEEYAEAAIRFGGRLAKEMSAEVSVLHVRPPISPRHRVQLTTARKKLGEWDLKIPGVDYLIRAKEILTEIGLTKTAPLKDKKVSQAFRIGIDGATELHLIGLKGELVRLRLREGHPVDEILEEADVGDYDLLIVGSRGHKGFSTHFVGSTALRVADLSACSVLIAKNIKEDDNFLLCTDGSHLSEKAEITGAEMARKLGAEMTILSIAEEKTQEKEEEAKQLTRRAEMILAQMGINAKQKVRTGRPSEEIIDEARDHDIVVMGSSGSSAVKKFFLGSTPLKVIEYGKCPVLIVREKRGKISLQEAHQS
ncbi:MAG: universal stress protein [Nitrospiria bacterium]